MREALLSLLRGLPGRAGAVLRRLAYAKAIGHRSFTLQADVELHDVRNMRIGRRFRVCPQVRLFAGGGSLTIGDDFFANYGCFISAEGGIVRIGDSVLFGPNVVIVSRNHVFSDPLRPIRLQGYEAGQVTIGDDVWIGASSTILPGVTIGDGSVIGAASVVTRDVPAGSVAVGSPARVVRTRGEPSVARG